MRKKQRPNKLIDFKIEHLDSIGQGVSKLDGKITFIQKVLADEEGQATIYKSKKNIQFASVNSISKTNDKRQESPCKFYDQCGGCHFLHTDYNNELIHKISAYIDNFRRQYKINISELLKVHKAPIRTGYRNRIQLQYDKKKDQIGFYNESNSSIVNIDECLMAMPELRDSIKYVLQTWKTEAKKNSGHVEIYYKNEEVLINYDARYSSQGFSQVFEEMNNQLLELVNRVIKETTSSNSTTIDLFGGNGNLSKAIDHKTFVIDATPTKFINLANPDHQEYIELDIYKEGSVEELSGMSLKDIDLLIIDPPRSGLKNIDEFVEMINPKYILYVSCNNQTLARDTFKIFDEYEISETHLFDFFPGTRHYESVNILKRR